MGPEEIDALVIVQHFPKDESADAKAKMASLLEEGVDVNLSDRRGRSLMFYAAQENNVECMKVLLDRGATVDILMDEGVTPLIQASFYGRLEAVQLLLDAGADPSIVDGTDDTALSCCCQAPPHMITDEKKANKAADLYFFAKLFAKPIQWLVKTLLCGEYLKYAEATTASVVNKLITDPKLRAILCGTFGNYGLTPEKGSFVIQAGIVAHYMDGGYYPVGGSQEISKALIPHADHLPPARVPCLCARPF